MYLTQKNQIRGLSAREFKSLRALCRLSKNMFNVGLYETRQHFFNERENLRYESIYHRVKENENYKLLQTDIAQQTLKIVDRSFQSFFGLWKKKQEWVYFQQANPPRYLPKKSYFLLVFTRIKVKDGYWFVPMSPAFKKEYGKVKIPFPKRLEGKKLKQVRIYPRYDARFFEVEYIVQEEQEQLPLAPEKALAIDLGLDNLASCVDTDGASFIVDGKKLKSVNQLYNKENARLQSIKDKQGIKGFTSRQARITIKRNNTVRDYLNKSARLIINYCIAKSIGTIVVGSNPGWKKEINLGNKTNQKFVQIPHWSLKQKLRGLCERYGLQYVEQEESYTSKSSFLDNDKLPVYNADNPKEHKFSGKRIKRGLYRSKEGLILNADLNGAANILRKSNHNFCRERVARGLLLNRPLRISSLRILVHANAWAG